LNKKAQRLAKEILIVDTHIDTPGLLQVKWMDISKRNTRGEFDYVRAKEGGLDAPFMSVYVAAQFENNGAKKEAELIIDIVNKVINSYPDKFASAYSVNDILNNFKLGKISLPMGMENGSPLEGDLKNVKYFYDKGIRYITLAHAKSNHISDSSYDTNKQWYGLSPFGKKVVEEMNNVGIMIDISHLTDEAAFQVLSLSKAPVIASHSSCRFFTPGWERNMSDELIQALAKNGGTIQINFGSSFLSKEILDRENKNRTDIENYINEHKMLQNEKEAREFSDKYWREHPVGYADVKDVVKHIDHVVKLVGIDHVGLGSDFDGVGDSLPTGLKDVSYYPNLIYELLKAGYNEVEIKKICGGNLLRVWSEVEKVASKNFTK
jgi:membrane dipeptidase